MVVAKGHSAEGDGAPLFAGDQISILPDDKVTEMNVEDGCATVRIYLMPVDHALKNG